MVSTISTAPAGSDFLIDRKAGEGPHGLRMQFTGQMNDQAIWAISRLLENNKEITSASFHGPQMGVSGIRIFAEALKVNDTLRELILTGTNLGDEGATILGEALLQRAVPLEILALGNNRITAKGLPVFQQVLSQGKVSSDLLLSNNPIGDQGATLLMEGITENLTLEKLTLGNCDITADGIRQIDAVCFNRAFTTEKNMIISLRGMNIVAVTAGTWTQDGKAVIALPSPIPFVQVAVQDIRVGNELRGKTITYRPSQTVILR